MPYWNDLITQKSWEMLQEMKRKQLERLSMKSPKRLRGLMKLK